MLQNLLQPLYSALEQIRFLLAVGLGAITLLCLAHTLDKRATILSRFIYLFILWLLLPTTISLLDSFYSLLSLPSRNSITQWQWLIIPTLLSLFTASFLITLILRAREREILDAILYTIATLLMIQRLYSHFS